MINPCTKFEDSRFTPFME